VTRRAFLSRVAAGLAAVASARVGLLSAGTARASAASSKPFTTALPIPKTLTGSDIRLVARPADVQILSGRATRMWTFNGTFPGPTIRRPAGQRTRLTVVNKLPAEAKSLTIHHHGSHSAPKHDGLPLPHVAIKRGASRTYIYEHMEDGAPERAAMQWYHDHSHHRTSFNSWMGLAGLFILDDEFEAKLPLPRGRYEIPLFLTDRRFTDDNQLDNRLFDTPAVNREVSGDVFLVNGAVRPYRNVEPRRYRLRIHNGSGFRIYNLSVRTKGDAPVPVVQIGTESGLLPASVKRDAVLLGPAERADVVVDFSQHAGKTLTLESTPWTNAAGSDSAPAARFLQFRVGTSVRWRDTSKVPKRLRPLPDWVSAAPTQADRVWAFGTGYDVTTGQQAHTVNGRAFDHDRVDAKVELGAVETWQLINTTTRSHYIHIHDVDWVVLDRNGAPPPAYEQGLKETFRLDPGESINVAAKFTDHLGRYVLHCHMLDHEDGGMMTAWEVVRPGAGAATTVTAAEQQRLDRVMAAIAARPGAPAPRAVLESLPLSRVRADEPGSPYRCTVR
jgi:spore coat protein A, manganese oxidase